MPAAVGAPIARFTSAFFYVCLRAFTQCGPLPRRFSRRSVSGAVLLVHFTGEVFLKASQLPAKERRSLNS